MLIEIWNVIIVSLFGLYLIVGLVSGEFVAIFNISYKRKDNPFGYYYWAIFIFIALLILIKISFFK